MSDKLHLPCLRGKMGDWFYYVTLMSFKEVSARTSMVPDIHKNLELSRWIQREVGDRIADIVEYLVQQKQRFFNSIICGIYGGKPSWQEIDIDKNVSFLNEEEKDYLERTFGILTLNGDEKIFAIDGQHRTKAIKEAVKTDKSLATEEVPMIFLAHKTDKFGEERTRRLFSTLNRYAVPVKISEIIALDEEDNGAILTRWVMEDFSLFKDKIQFSKGRNLNVNNKLHFTNIILLYDIICITLTNKSYSKNITIEDGYNLNEFTKKRMKEDALKTEFDSLKLFFEKIIAKIPSLKKYFFNSIEINRNNAGTSFLFRPVGQLILFYVLKVAKQNNHLNKALNYFAKDDFNLKNPVWKKVFIDEESKTLKTDKPRQTLAIQAILQHLGIKVYMTVKEKEFFDAMNLKIKEL